MKLFEHEAKAFGANFNLPLPRSLLASTADQAREGAKNLGKNCVIKAQVLVSGRGKAGGIRFASTPEEAYQIAQILLGSYVKGEKILNLLVEERIPSKKELYLGLVVDRSKHCYSMLASTEGGVDIEEVSEKAPEKIVRRDVNPLSGLHEYEAREIAVKLGYEGSQLLELASIILKLYRITVACDGELVETNPLIETPEGTFVAADLRILIDDSSLFKHPDFQKRAMEMTEELKPLEMKSREKRLTYVELDGDIGVVGNGAGLVMATLDMIKHYGGKPANFCDIGGGASAERVSDAIEIVLSNQKVKILLVNILGGITRCDEVAKGILAVRERIGAPKPMVIRLVGTNDEVGRRMLVEAGIKSFESMENATEKAVELASEA
jgi:succinyl-CoA synthetase beta subunit